MKPHIGLIRTNGINKHMKIYEEIIMEICGVYIINQHNGKKGNIVEIPDSYNETKKT